MREGESISVAREARDDDNPYASLQGGDVVVRDWGKVLKPTKVHREYTILRRAGSAFLMTLPAWPLGTV